MMNLHHFLTYPPMPNCCWFRCVFCLSRVVVPMPMGYKKNMRTAVLNKLAGDLAAAWPDPAQPVKLARSVFPLDRSEAYYVQDQMHHLLDQGLAGWKVGATSRKMRELDGHDDVIPGRIFATRSYIGSKHNLLIADFPNARVETEFAFRLIKAPVMRQAPWTAEELVSMMTLHPAIEIIGNRRGIMRFEGIRK